MTELPQSFVDQRLGEQLGLLIDRNAESAEPVTLADAMQFARAAYYQGYTDYLLGVKPERAA